MSLPALLNVQVKNPHSPDFVFHTTVSKQLTVSALKSLLSTTYRSHPPAHAQRLISAGRLLADSEILEDVFAKENGAHNEFVVHLAVKESPASASASTSSSSSPTAASAPLHSSATTTPPVAAASAVSSSSSLPSAAPVAAHGAVPPSAFPSQFPSMSSAFAPSPYAYPSYHPATLQQAQAAYMQAQLHAQMQMQVMYYQQLAAASAVTQYPGLRHRQTSTPNPTPSSFSAPTASSVPTGGHSGLSVLTAPFFLPPFGFPASTLTPHIPLTASSLPSFSPTPSSSTSASLPSSSPAPATAPATTPAAAAPAAAADVAPAAVARNARWAAVRRYVDVRLLIKLVVLLLVFSRQGDSTRSLLLMAAAVVAYLWQVGAFRRREPEPAAGEGENREVLAEARREAREERRAGGGAGGFGGFFGGMDEDEDEDDDIALQREQLHILQQQHQAEMIRRGVRVGGQGGEGTVVEQDTWVGVVEKFIVGLFASLVPSWRPTIPGMPAVAAA